jgi:hypothetical protein
MLPENLIHFRFYLAYKDWFFICLDKGFYDKQPLFRTRNEAVAWALMNLDDIPFTIQTLEDSDGWMWAGSLKSIL